MFYNKRDNSFISDSIINKRWKKRGFDVLLPRKTVKSESETKSTMICRLICRREKVIVRGCKAGE